jgi:serine/threonine protein kinase
MSGVKQVGDWIGERYEVFEVHRGGMGLVYVVHDHLGGANRRVVALKTLREELMFDAERSARFAKECRLWVRLGEHPNIVRALAVEEIEGRPHVVLELVTGHDLRAWIGTPRLNLRMALRFGMEFCLGMEHAIRQGLKCHRDIKPGNLMVTPEGILKITDFGLARVRAELITSSAGEIDGPIPLVEGAKAQPIVWTDARDRPKSNEPDLDSSPRTGPADWESDPEATRIAAREPTPERRARGEEPKQARKRAAKPPGPDDETAIPDPDASSTIEWRPRPRKARQGQLPYETQTGLFLGTCPYMAPEQFRDAKSADVRADIYSFGVVLFEMITGVRPFRGNSFAKLQHQHARYEPPSVMPSIPRRYHRAAESLNEVVQRCLKKDPGERYVTIGKLRRALTEVVRRVPGG